MKTNKNMKVWEMLKLMKRRDKHSERRIELPHTLKSLNNKNN
jgi:hypothetical protein